MEKIKLLLYCTKSKPYLLRDMFDKFLIEKNFDVYDNNGKKEDYFLNGKIIAECDFEVEEIKCEEKYGVYYTNNINAYDLINKSYLSAEQLDEYLKGKNGYAIHIKNLNIFDKPREVNEYLGAIKKDSVFYPLQNCSSMMCVYQRKDLNNIDYNNFDWGLLDKTNIEDVNKYIVISVSSQEMCRICNGEKTIEVRRKVLKEMLK